MAPYSEKLVAFLYILMRDELVPGTVAKILHEHVEKLDADLYIVRYTNSFLEAYAREIAEKLVAPQGLVKPCFDIDEVLREGYPSVDSDLNYQCQKCGKQIPQLGTCDRCFEQLLPACKLPPAGWCCTRGSGHSGPCAAVPDGQ